MSEGTINNVMFDRRSQYIKPDFYPWDLQGLSLHHDKAKRKVKNQVTLRRIPTLHPRNS
ncbi:hypothetical protein [Dapis sp. BLCC M172]|uniref:hypothetical protein n=1 Tax=Dapis sp. BLCC M172 TaxID=2975281 RepID=UPI003CEEF57D